MSIYEKLSDIQTSLKAPKGQFNAFGKYNYRNCEDILNALKPFLSEHGLYLAISDEMVMLGDRFYVKATATLSDGEASVSNTAYAREAESKKGMDESQITGAASSYARKYCLNGLLAIDDTKDADSTNNHNDAKAEGMVDKAKIALEKGDWATLYELDRQGEDWLAAWKLLDTRKKKAIKDLMNKRDEYRDALNLAAPTDESGTLQLWDEMTKEEKSEVWRCVTEETKEFITKVKEAEK
jgi:predicted Fe-S protein YdhL (DUF1289 family)